MGKQIQTVYDRKMSTNRTITVTATDLTRCGFSRDRVRDALLTVPPVSTQGRVKYFDLQQAIAAVINTGESPKDREARLKADIMEEKLRRMKGESIDRETTICVWGDKMVRMRYVIQGCESLSKKDQVRLANAIRLECNRIPDEIESAQFPEANPENEEDHNDE